MTTSSSCFDGHKRKCGRSALAYSNVWGENLVALTQKALSSLSLETQIFWICIDSFTSVPLASTKYFVVGAQGSDDGRA